MRQHRLIATGTHLLIAAAMLGAPAGHGARQTSDDAYSCETSLDAPSAAGMANLAFNSLFPIVRGDVAGRQAAFVLDTGNQAGTQLWERFQRDFTALVSERGKKGTVRVTQFGGSNEHEVIVLPELALRIGGFDALLKPANVFSRPVGDDRWHGNLGMDVLSQAEEVIIDFRSMSITLRRPQ